MIRLLHDSGDQVALASLVDLEHLLSLGVTQPLQDDLFGGLRCDAPEITRGVLPLIDDVAVLVELLAVHDDLAGVGVDGHPCLLGGAGSAFVGRHERVGQRVENGVCRHTFFALEKL